MIQKYYVLTIILQGINNCELTLFVMLTIFTKIYIYLLVSYLTINYVTNQLKKKGRCHFVYRYLNFPN